MRVVSTRLERKMSRCFSNVKRETAAINQRGIPVCFRTGFRRKGGAFQVHDSWEVSRYEKSIRHPLHTPPTSPPFFPPLLLPRLRNHSPTFYPPIFFLFFFSPFLFLSQSSLEHRLRAFQIFRSWENFWKSIELFERVCWKVQVRRKKQFIEG